MTNRILSPLHFEDMEPHRFEDLVRNLLYDFRDWRSIEATGRGGGDDGFDVRAWEKAEYVTNQDEDSENENAEGIHPMEGNLWMVQCKREKHLGPKRIQEIIRENILANDPPYGFMVVALANFSKKAYDAFRDELRIMGVMEFYLWGKAELEDMLFLPKNDRILFAFMGISLVSRKRSIATEVKFSLNNKNKLLRVLNQGKNRQNFSQSILLRDIFDEDYPFVDKYPDFKTRPRWKEFIAWNCHPRGLLIHAHEYYAYFDKKKSVDYVDAIDLLHRESEKLYYNDEERQKRYELRERISDYWEHLPKKNQTMLCIEALIPYKDMLIIDDKGDGYHDFPHIFIDCNSSGNLLQGCLIRYRLKTGNNNPGEFLKEEDLRLRVFPSSFPDKRKGVFHEDKIVEWDWETLRRFKNGYSYVDTLFDVDHRYDYLNPRDRIRVKGEEHDKEEMYIRVTHGYDTTVIKYLKEMGEHHKSDIEKQVGREVKHRETLRVFEIKRCYDWEL